MLLTGRWPRRSWFRRSSLVLACSESQFSYNIWRPHITLGGLRPDDVYYGRKTKKPSRNVNTVP